MPSVMEIENRSVIMHKIPNAPNSRLSGKVPGSLMLLVCKYPVYIFAVPLMSDLLPAQNNLLEKGALSLKFQLRW